MPTDLNPAVRGHQPAGPKRWARAKQWAEANPDSKLAKQYQARVDAAREFALAAGDMPWLHFRPPRSWAGEEDPVYQWQTCSTRCMGMQVQLDAGVTGLEALYAVATDPDKKLRTIVQPRPEDSTRRGKCKVCGGDVTGGAPSVI